MTVERMSTEEPVGTVSTLRFLRTKEELASGPRQADNLLHPTARESGRHSGRCVCADKGEAASLFPGM